MMINTTKIYLVTNCYGDPNKVYIGKTIKSRKNAHNRTYGPQIIYTVIDEIDSTYHKVWKPIEMYWIEQFKQWGFNVLNKNMGGGGPEKYSDEVKQKMSKPKSSSKRGSEHGLFGKIKSLKHKQNISKSRLCLHLKYSDEAKQKISKAKQGCKYPTLQKPVEQYDRYGNFIKEYNSISEANISLNKNPNSGDISLGCNGKRGIVYGFIWKWKKQIS